MSDKETKSVELDDTPVKKSKKKTDNQVIPDMTESAVYLAIIKKYTSKKSGKFSCGLLNKDFIQFAATSRKVSTMVANREDIDAIITHIVRSRVEAIANSSRHSAPTDAEIQGIMTALNAIYEKGVFKDLRSHVKRMLAA